MVYWARVGTGAALGKTLRWMLRKRQAQRGECSIWTCAVMEIAPDSQALSYHILCNSVQQMWCDLWITGWGASDELNCSFRMSLDN